MGSLSEQLLLSFAEEAIQQNHNNMGMVVDTLIISQIHSPAISHTSQLDRSQPADSFICHYPDVGSNDN